MNEVKGMRTPELVREFAELKVWFATHEITGPIREGDAKHHRLGAVVNELRSRGVLD
jgi:hypothetical protein